MQLPRRCASWSARHEREYHVLKGLNVYVDVRQLCNGVDGGSQIATPKRRRVICAFLNGLEKEINGDYVQYARGGFLLSRVVSHPMET